MDNNKYNTIIIKKCKYLLEKSVNTRNTTIPTVLEILQSESLILCISLLSL